MRKLADALRYGNKKTKRYILSAIFVLIFGIVSGIVFAVTHVPLWGMSTILCLTYIFILMQSMRFSNSGKFIQEKEKRQAARPVGETSLKEKQEKKPEDIYESMDEKEVKKIMVKYKVRKDHRCIMIDSCESKKIYQCPAYAWVEKEQLELLLFEKDPRKISFSANEVKSLTYERAAYANPLKDYLAFTKPSFIRLVFQSYLPTIYEERIGQYRKNLYVIGKDLKVTNTSAKTMMELLNLKLSVSSMIGNVKYQNPYFEAAYGLNIMLKDGVLNPSEYKVKVKEVLSSLTQANIRQEEFCEYMDQLVSRRLVTKEYAQYYMERRK